MEIDITNGTENIYSSAVEVDIQESFSDNFHAVSGNGFYTIDIADRCTPGSIYSYSLSR